MKVASWNVNSLKVRLPHVLRWLQEAQPDVLALQETKVADENFPAEEIRSAGFEVCFAGQKTYNGVALISHRPPQSVVTDPPGMPDEQRRILCASYGPLRVINLYVPNGKAVGTDAYVYKLDWMQRISTYVQQQLQAHENLVVVGDFNVAPEDRDVHDPEAWHEKILCSSAERAALKSLLDCGLRDSFRLFDQPPGTYSWWDYRMGAFRRNRGLRIDLLLTSGAVSRRCTTSSVDKAPRGWERPSDHAPVFIEFD